MLFHCKNKQNDFLCNAFGTVETQSQCWNPSVWYVLSAEHELVPFCSEQHKKCSEEFLIKISRLCYRFIFNSVTRFFEHSKLILRSRVLGLWCATLWSSAKCPSFRKNLAGKLIFFKKLFSEITDFLQLERIFRNSNNTHTTTIPLRSHEVLQSYSKLMFLKNKTEFSIKKKALPVLPATFHTFVILYQ